MAKKKVLKEVEKKIAEVTPQPIKDVFDENQAEATSWIQRNPKTVLAIAAAALLVIVWLVL